MGVINVDRVHRDFDQDRGTKKRAKNPIDDPQLPEKIAQVVCNLVDQS